MGDGRAPPGREAATPGPAPADHPPPGPLPPPATPERCLSRRQARHRNPVRGAGDVVQPDGVTEVDRRGLPTVLAADAHLEPPPGAPPPGDRELHESTHPVPIERDEGVLRIHA